MAEEFPESRTERLQKRLREYEQGLRALQGAEGEDLQMKLVEETGEILITKRRGEGGDFAGDREPRNPLPVAPQAGAIALEAAAKE